MLTALALGGLAGIDRTAFAQTMFAHPVVCGTLAGWIVGDPADGLRLGIVFGMIGGRSVPIGGERKVIDWSSAAIAAPLALGPSAAGWQWGLALVMVLAGALGGGLLIRFVRRLSARREGHVQAAALSGDLAAIERVHLVGLFTHFVRGALVTAALVELTGWFAFDLAWTGSEQALGSYLWLCAPLFGVTVLLQTSLKTAGWRPVTLGGILAGMLIFVAGVMP